MIDIEALLANKPDVRFDLPTKALQRWQPDLQAAATEEKDNSISILDPIGQDFWGEGVTAKRISSALRYIGADNPVTVNINSPGGDVFEGLAIYSLLAEHRGHVTVKILGLAASAASIIAMAGDTVQISKAGFYMIHNCWTLAAGDRHFLRGIGDYLEPFDDAMAGVYKDRTGINKTELASLMDSETWLNGETSIDRGFADEFLSSDSVVAIAGTDQVATALRKADMAMAKAGVPRSERRRLINQIKSSKQDAAGGGTQNATATDTQNAIEQPPLEILSVTESITIFRTYTQRTQS